MRKYPVVGLLVTTALGLSLTACQDPLGSKAKQDNEQLKGQVSTLQKENTDLRGRLDELTTTRDTLTKDNDALKTENEVLKAKKPSGSTTKSPRK
jgi:predicted nuclease with TOPRIM domain